MTATRPGYVYFLVMRKSHESDHDSGLVKIGITRGDVLHRIASLQTGNPHELVCAAEPIETSWPRDVELYMHRTHAAEMRQTEWLQCARDGIAALVAEAREAARHIEERKSREHSYASQPSNGQVRRATIEEFKLHSQARKLKKELVPTQLRLETAESRLKAATGTTFGIPGIVRAKHVPATFRFSARLAETKFPELASQCREDTIAGRFHWRKVPRPSHFATDNHAAKNERLAAATSVTSVLQRNVTLNGWTPRNTELERWHDDFLQATRIIHRLEAELADLQTNLIIRLGEYDALDGVCSFKRYIASTIDGSAFCSRFHEESKQCVRLIPPRLRKRVYPTRSYF